MKNLFLPLLFAVALSVSGCTGYGGNPATTTTSAPISTIATTAVSVTPTTIAETTTTTAIVTTMTTQSVKEFQMAASQWKFEPRTIAVKQGDTVRLQIKSIDVTHGFNLPDFGVNKQLEPGETAIVEFVADKKGTFTFSCSVVCGSGHSGMTGKLVVE